MSDKNMLAPPLSALGELRRGWLVILSAMYCVGIGLSFLAYCFSIFIAPLEEEFGWSRTSIAFAPAFLSLFIALTGAATGRLCDRYGARAVMLPSIALFAMVLAAFSLLQGSIVWLYVGFSLATALGIGTSTITYTRIVSGWFDKARGLALGLTTSGAGVAAFVMPLVLRSVVDGQGWRAGWLVCGAVALSALVPAWLFLRERPRAPGEKAAERLYGVTIRHALRDRRFWFLVVAAGLISTVVAGTVVHLMPMLGEQGFSRTTAAGYVSLLGVGIIAGRLIAGFLLDRVPGPPLAAALILATVVGFLMLFAGPPAAAPIAILLIGLTVGSEGDFLAFFASRYFGMRSYAEIYGWFYVMLCIGSATGPFTISLIYREATGYTPVYLTFALLGLTAAALMAFLGRYPVWGARRDEEAPAPVSTASVRP